MHLHLPHLIYSGPALDDPDLLPRLPAPLANALKERNGCCAWLGVLHVRGACTAPTWHSLRNAMEGPDALANLYPDLRPTDLPFAEEAFGDQFLLRDDQVWRLFGETGELEPWERSALPATEGTDSADNGIESWFRALLNDPADILGYEPLQALEAIASAQLEPGKLISVYPPFAISAESVKREFKPIDTLTRRGWLAGLAAKMKDLPDGAEIEIRAP